MVIEKLNTIVSSSRKRKGCLATFVEMKSIFYIAISTKDRTKESMNKAVQKLITALLKAALKSFTSYKGKEFYCYRGVEKEGISFNFADSYSAW